MESKLLKAALWYANKNGWWVFPTREKEGKPYMKNGALTIPKVKTPYTTNGFKDATNNPDEIRWFWNKFPEAAIGVDCERSGVFLIDIDNHNVDNEGDGYRAWMMLGIPTNNAWMASTPRRGTHYIFSGQGKTSEGRVSKNIDTRGRGGYFIAPPSHIYYDGIKRYYARENDWSNPPMSISERDYLRLGLERKDSVKSDKLYPKNTTEDFNKAKQILKDFPVEHLYSYQIWYKIGMALKNEFGDSGFPLWEAVSEKYFKEKPHSVRANTLGRRWDTFSRRDDGVKLGTIIKYAKEGDPF